MSDANKPAYVMVQIKARDVDETMRRYGHDAIATVVKFGGEMLAGTPAPMVLEGSWEKNWAAILRFPSLAMAQAWYSSAEYQPLKALRVNELTEDALVLML